MCWGLGDGVGTWWGGVGRGELVGGGEVWGGEELVLTISWGGDGEGGVRYECVLVASTLEAIAW